MLNNKINYTTKSEHQILAFLRENSHSEYIYRVDIKQSELANHFSISRQALSVKLRPLMEKGYIRTGRGFIELTIKGLNVLGHYGKSAFILVKVEPSLREEIYRIVVDYKIGKVNRVAGDIDLVLEVDGDSTATVLDKISRIAGVTSTKTYFTLEVIS